MRGRANAVVRMNAGEGIKARGHIDEAGIRSKTCIPTSAAGTRDMGIIASTCTCHGILAQIQQVAANRGTLGNEAIEGHAHFRRSSPYLIPNRYNRHTRSRLAITRQHHREPHPTSCPRPRLHPN